MKQMNLMELENVNGGLGGGPSYNHPKPNAARGKCVGGTVAGILIGISTGNPFGLAGSTLAGIVASC
ncbi:hypothetical protein ACTQ4K_04295 [Clostridium sporogenes]|uniref:hypothetical protein n=1 Tax=Clostridium sporogenes TaxID=1509 RepID=UPI003F92B604|nr:Blp family class II bacteriocin [Clostridium botulinum]